MGGVEYFLHRGHIEEAPDPYQFDRYGPEHQPVGEKAEAEGGKFPTAHGPAVEDLAGDGSQQGHGHGLPVQQRVGQGHGPVLPAMQVQEEEKGDHGCCGLDNT